MNATLEYHHRPLTTFDKALLAVAGVLAVALFLSVGWLAAAPADPEGAVSLLAAQRPLLMIVQLTALAAVASGLATAMLGGKLPDVGLFIAAVGFTAISVQGETTSFLLMHTGDEVVSIRSIASKLAGEEVVWLVALAIATWVGWAVHRWIGAERSWHVSEKQLAVSEAASLLRNRGTDDGERAWFAGFKFTGITAITAVCVFWLFSSGSSPRWVEHGQVCFAAFAAYYAGIWVAKHFVQPRTAFWGLLAIPFAGVGGYLWAMFVGEGGSVYDLASVPASRFLRPLPLTYAGMAVIGVLTAHWSTSQRLHADEAPAATTR